MSIKYTLPEGQSTIRKESEEDLSSEAHFPSPSDYIIIAEENVFHPERKIAPEKSEEQSLPKPDLVLYGTLITDDVQLAYLEDRKIPRNTPGRGKRQISLKKGDVLSGFKLQEIYSDNIVLVRGEEKIIVHVIDSQKPKARDTVTTAIKAASGVSAQPSPTPATASKKLTPTIPTSVSPTKTMAPISPVDDKIRDALRRQKTIRKQ